MSETLFLGVYFLEGVLGLFLVGCFVAGVPGGLPGAAGAGGGRSRGRVPVPPPSLEPGPGRGGAALGTGPGRLGGAGAYGTFHGTFLGTEPGERATGGTTGSGTGRDAETGAGWSLRWGTWKLGQDGALRAAHGDRGRMETPGEAGAEG